MYLLRLVTIAQGTHPLRLRNCIWAECWASFSTQTCFLALKSIGQPAALWTVLGCRHTPTFSVQEDLLGLPGGGVGCYLSFRGETEAQGSWRDLPGAQSQLLARLTA